MNEKIYNLTDFDGANDEIVINGRIFAKGHANVEIIKKDKATVDGYRHSQEYLEINGVLATEYYEKDIRTIETRRYYIEDIDVYKEQYGTKEDLIAYHFNAGSIVVKYQTGEYEIELEDMLPK